MTQSPDADRGGSRRIGRRMFGDYPVTGTAYWVWLAGIGAAGLVSLVLMFALRA